MRAILVEWVIQVITYLFKGDQFIEFFLGSSYNVN